VIIGIDLNKEKITEELNSCLLTEKELKLKPAKWEDFEDPFEDWECMLESSDEDEEDSGLIFPVFVFSILLFHCDYLCTFIYLLVEEMKISQHVHTNNCKHDREDGTDDEGKPHKHTKYCHNTDGV
jgi:hypothetical protein